LDYLYSGQIDQNTLNPLKAVEVMKLSGVYKLEGLHQFCSKFLQNGLTNDNIFKLLKHAYSLNVETGKQLCMDYAVSHEHLFTSALTDVLGLKLYQEVMGAILKGKKDKAEVQLAFDDPIINDFKNVFESDTKDIVFSLKGEEIKVHKAMLLYQSAPLTELVTEEIKKNLPIWSLDPKYSNITAHAFDSMFRYFYYGSHQLDVIDACQLFVFAREMNLDKLTYLIEAVLARKEFSLVSIISILDIAFSPLLSSSPDLQNQLQDNGIRYAVTNIDKIDFSSLMQRSPLIGMNILTLLQQALGQSWASISAETTLTSISSEKPLTAYPERSRQSLSDPAISEDISERSESSKRGRTSLAPERKKKKTSSNNLTEKPLNRKRSNKT